MHHATTAWPDPLSVRLSTARDALVADLDAVGPGSQLVVGASRIVLVGE